jgi:hypothetical protein
MSGSLANGQKGKEPSLTGGAAQRAKSAPGTRTRTKTKADEAVESGGSTWAADTVKRGKQYEAIFNEWREGIDCTTLAQRHGITSRRVRQIVDEMRAGSAEVVDMTNPMVGLQYVDGLIVQLDRAVTNAALILEGAMEEKNWAVSVGAHRRLAESRRELLELKQLRGIVPKNLALIEEQWSLVRLVQRILAVMERHGFSDEVRLEIAEAGRLATRTDRGTLELDMRPSGGV